MPPIKKFKIIQNAGKTVVKKILKTAVVEGVKLFPGGHYVSEALKQYKKKK